MVWDTGLLVMEQSTRTEILHILITNLINICSFWEISIFEMTALISCTSHTMLDRNRPYIGGERWFGIFCNHSIDVQSTASTEILQTFPMTNLIDICSFWEYRHSPWRYCSRVHRILCWIEIGLKLVERGGLEFLLPQHWLMISSQASENFTHPDASIDQYIVVLRISTLFMTILISCTSKTLLDRNRS